MDAPPSTRMILQVLNTLHSVTDLAMTPQHEDAAVQGGQVFAEEMDPGNPFLVWRAV